MSAFAVDPALGLVYGRRGPVGSLDSAGYLQIDGRSRGLGMLSAHRLVWESVHGPIPIALEINHKNGIKTDNRIANLELVTHQENIQHAYTTGLKSNAGESHPSAVLNDALVREIRAIYRPRSRHANARVLACRFGVTRKCISDVVSRRTWGHV